MSARVPRCDTVTGCEQLVKARASWPRMTHDGGDRHFAAWHAEDVLDDGHGPQRLDDVGDRRLDLLCTW